MKPYIVFLIQVLSFLGFCGCEQEPISQVIIHKPAHRFWSPGDTVPLSASVPVAWEVLSGPGDITEAGVLKIPDSTGWVRVVATGLRHKTTPDTLTVYVSRHAALFNALDTGGYVIYFRHAIAQTGKDQFTYPTGWHRSCQSDTARQLSPEGMMQATAIGMGLSALDLPIAPVGYVSEFCRCQQSATLIYPGVSWRTSPDLTFYVYDEAQRHARTLSLIAGLQPGSQNTLIIAHSFGPGSDFPELAQGYAAVFDPAGPMLLGYLTDKDITVFSP